jgi:hypothetical protein
VDDGYQKTRLIILIPLYLTGSRNDVAEAAIQNFSATYDQRVFGTGYPAQRDAAS